MSDELEVLRALFAEDQEAGDKEKVAYVADLIKTINDAAKAVGAPPAFLWNEERQTWMMDPELHALLKEDPTLLDNLAK